MPQISGNKFVVVGGASLLGSHIGEQLLAAGAREVVLMDNLALGSTSNIETVLNDTRCTFVRGDILRLNELLDVLTQADGVFNVAGFLTAPIAANPWMGLDVNIRGLQNVLEASRHHRVSKVVFSSTVGIYGEASDDPTDELSPLRWEGASPAIILYWTSKIMGEGLGRLYAQNHGVDFVALRYGAIYGERQHKRAIDATRIVQAYERLRAGEPAVIQGSGDQLQDFVYVGDVARANLLAMESDASGVGINIASGVDTSQRELIGLVTKACGSDLQPIHHHDPNVIENFSGKKPFSRQAAKRLLGWEPEVTLDEGITRLVRWLDEQATPSAHT